MDKRDISIMLAVGLVVAGWIGWVVTHYEEPGREAPRATESEAAPSPAPRQEAPVAASSLAATEEETPDPLDAVPGQGVSVTLGGPAAEDSGSFPPPTVEVVNGRPERTIHMGVRQYAWDPATITAKKGELVRLIVHNADVKHGLVIPELGVLNIDIPPEGAVIEFEASKAGTFVFFCSYYCGEGHSEMRGQLIIEE